MGGCVGSEAQGGLEWPGRSWMVEELGGVSSSVTELGGEQRGAGVVGPTDEGGLGLEALEGAA